MDRHPEKPILIVDDEESWLVTIETLLARQSGIKNVVSCSNCRRVKDVLKEQEFSLVLLDYIMPGCSAEELLTHIVKTYPKLPVVILTGLDHTETAARCIELGAKNYLVKSLNVEQMLQTIDENLGFLKGSRLAEQLW